MGEFASIFAGVVGYALGVSGVGGEGRGYNGGGMERAGYRILDANFNRAREAFRIEEVEYVPEMARRIAALILMQSDLDANYEAIKADTWPWPHDEQGAR